MDTRMNHIKQMYQQGEYSLVVALRLLDALSIPEHTAIRFLQNVDGLSGRVGS